MTGPVKSSNRGSVVWIAVLALVVVVGVVAVVASRGSNQTEVDANATSDVQVGATSSTTAGGTGSSTTSGDTPSSANEAVPSSAKPLATFESVADDPAVGKTIPTISGKTLDGDPITIGPDGKAKVIVFAAHWCPHCQREIPLLAEHLKDSPMPDDVELLTVSTGVSPERGNYPPKAWFDREGWTAPVMADSDDSVAAATYGLSSYPFFVVADADGKVVLRISGELSTAEFDQLVQAAQTGESPV